MLKSLWNARALIWTLVKKDLKVRYKASALGFLWSFGRPLLLMLILWSVFSQIIRVPLRTPELPYALHLLGGLLPWMYLNGAVGESVYSLLQHANVIKKVALPTEVFPAATVFSHLIHFFLAMMVLFCFMIPMGVWPDWTFCWLPVLVIAQTLFTLALAFLVAGLHVFYRDVASITEILMTAWFYITPVIYPIYMAEEKLRATSGWVKPFAFYLINPMAGLTAAYRQTLFGSSLTPPELSPSLFLFAWAWAFVAGSLLWLVAAPVYRKLSASFADEL